MIKTHCLGFPRIGAARELKFALESYWQGKSTLSELEAVGAKLRQQTWQIQRDANLAYVTVGDFAFYDQVANHVQWLGCIPPRFEFPHQTHPLTAYFTLARGTAQETADEKQGLTTQHAPLEMTKWFDTNYHYLVPEWHADTAFNVQVSGLLAQVKEAQNLGHSVKVVIIGPLTLLWLGKAQTTFERLDLLPRLQTAYCTLLSQLKSSGVEWVQIDEPILGLDLPAAWLQNFEPCYQQLSACSPNILLATYFSPLAENLRRACELPVAGLHIDAVRAADEVTRVADWLPAHKVLSVGVVDGRNIWRTDLDAALAQLKPLLQRRQSLWIAPSCSLLHVPVTLASETDLPQEISRGLAFAVEKLGEIDILKKALTHPEEAQSALTAWRFEWTQFKQQVQRHRPEVEQAKNALPPNADQRQSPFDQRRSEQQIRFQLPLLPTTTIGSFPQTAEIRRTRAAFRKNQLSTADYKKAMCREIAAVIAEQEAIGLDVLVHGEAERTDMVEYFGEQLDGILFSRFGWVQSYGSRCVKPPIIYGDVWRSSPMTVEWTTYAQSLSQRPVKGMLTGPITILQWSFVRNDQPRAETALQIALAIRAEVMDLERAGIGMIQIDEPALREGLPLRRSDWDEYLRWACYAFRICAGGVSNSTQIHTHMCYAEFGDILAAITSLDADVITIESSRSAMVLLRDFADFKYPNDIGPGIYDIHSPRIPSVEEIVSLLQKALGVINKERLWVNPDCGLKTRGWAETKAALHNMVAAAKQIRDTLHQ